MKDPVAAIENGCGPALVRDKNGRTRVHKCERDGCDVLLDKNFPSRRALVDMDHPDLDLTEEESRCDYLFVAGKHNDCWVVPIELTSGPNKKPSILKKQLDSGAELANRYLPRSTNARLLPVFATRGRVKPVVARLIRQLRINFRGQSKFPRKIRCGDPLSNALKQK